MKWIVVQKSTLVGGFSLPDTNQLVVTSDGEVYQCSARFGSNLESIMTPEHRKPNIVNMDDIYDIDDMIDVKQLDNEIGIDCQRDFTRGTISRSYSVYLGDKVYFFDQYGSNCGHLATQYKKNLADTIKTVIDQYHEDLSSKQ